MIPVYGLAIKQPGGPFDHWLFNRRTPGPDDILIDILYCGICHSDIHQVLNEWNNGTYPMVPGHEIVGKVSAAGKSTTGFQIGDIVGVGCYVDSCRSCRSCRSGQEQYCETGVSWTYNSFEQDKATRTYGGYSSRIVVKADYVFHIPPGLDPAAAAPLLCAGVTTFAPMKKWGIGQGHRVGVIGLGGLGHIAVKMAASLGAEVIVISSHAEKKADAVRLGASAFIQGADNRFKGQFHFLFDTISAPHAYAPYLSLLRTNGVYVCIGLPPHPITLQPSLLIDHGISVTGSLVGGLQTTRDMLQHCAQHQLSADIQLIKPDFVKTAYERALQGAVKYRYVIDLTRLNT
ncbi:MAG TPA: NAD(P)-dependent alcohol dehydrogenase [Chitinophaga sp.]|uniref:NAD(P)-dependent alcohol dehydrogenase n=1 Tax=Chitinophaga sp. TaxID=1869181 RepID=UPI002C0A3A4C|nr:NAD(P)-dependent alcohol dehydrogenase [Chitinophaga sp.]HVI46653.1 NAD(P)-dependent alcohol dehydrogenase [Chitinophaga sp.]